MKSLTLDEIEPLLTGQIDVRQRRDSLQPLRLPVAELGFYDPFNRWVGSCAAACRVRLSTASRSVRLKARP